MERLKGIDERSKSEIEAKLAKMGDYVRIHYLERALASPLDSDTKKFVLMRLAKIYEDKGMYVEGAKMVRNAADINITFKAKINDYMKAIELLIKGGAFQEADMLFVQTLTLGNSIEKPEMKNKYKDFYITQARLFLSTGRRSHAKKTYERILKLEAISPEEKKDAQKQLLDLYTKLGNVREYGNLKNSISGA